MNHDPAKFWRKQSYYHQWRADRWKKIARVLAGVLVGIIIITTYQLAHT